MKNLNLIPSGALLLCAVLLVGCGEEKKTDASHSSEQEEHLHDEAQETHRVEFKEGQGLSMPLEMSQLLGVKIIDVEEGKATRQIDLALRVFKADVNRVVLGSSAISTNEASLLKPGNTVAIQAEGTTQVEGVITSVEPASAKLTGMAEVIVKFPGSNAVTMGSFVDGMVLLTNETDVVVIPKEALLKTAEGSFVYVVNGDRLFRTKIGVGGSHGKVVEVTDGLYSGDKVVLQPIMPLWMAELQAIRGGKACADGH